MSSKCCRSVENCWGAATKSLEQPQNCSGSRKKVLVRTGSGISPPVVCPGKFCLALKPVAAVPDKKFSQPDRLSRIWLAVVRSAKCADRVPGIHDKSAATSVAVRYSRPHRARRTRNPQTRRVASRRICARPTQGVEAVRSPYRYLSARIYSRIARPQTLHCALAPASPQATGHTVCDRLRLTYGPASSGIGALAQCPGGALQRQSRTDWPA